MGHGLRHPGDLVAWRHWHESRHPARSLLRSAKSRLRPTTPGAADLLEPEGEPDVMVAVEATHASVAHAVVAPLDHLEAPRTSIVAPVGWQAPSSYSSHRRRTINLADLPSITAPRAVLAAGHYTEIGSAAFEAAEQHEAAFFVSQHGALTPFAPPLPRAARLLTWSEQDGKFWTAGRQDVEVKVTGSQLLWNAGLATDTGASSTTDAGKDRLVYLGQGHAAELSRARLAHAAMTTCREHGAVYRPHPSERDITSRAVLAAYARAGITVDISGVPLVELEAPIVSVFSTGVLEAAARGRPTWVDFPRPPAWLSEFWERYDMRQLGDQPTPPPARGTDEPARRIAEIVAAGAS